MAQGPTTMEPAQAMVQANNVTMATIKVTPLTTGGAKRIKLAMAKMEQAYYSDKSIQNMIHPKGVDI